jgi:Fic/DOC family/Protein of unknown function (DUF1488)
MGNAMGLDVRLQDSSLRSLFIHPYTDGNGRMARFLMNVTLASGAYPSTAIRVEDRTGYLEALNRESIDMERQDVLRICRERVRRPVERRELKSPVSEERHVSDRGVVVFLGKDGNKRVCCEISREALEDHSERITNTNRRY